MNKQEFLTRLRDGLVDLPPKDVEERLTFYGEMLDDRIEEGLSEEDAVAAAGDVDRLVEQIIAETPRAKIAGGRIRPRRKLTAWEIVLLALGSPIWLSLTIAAAAVVLSLYVSLWAVIVSLWAAFVAMAGGSLGGIAAGIVFISTDHALSGVATIAAAVVLAGLCIFAFYGCLAATKATLRLTKSVTIWAKNRMMRKEAT